MNKNASLPKLLVEGQLTLPNFPVYNNATQESQAHEEGLEAAHAAKAVAPEQGPAASHSLPTPLTASPKDDGANSSAPPSPQTTLLETPIQEGLATRDAPPLFDEASSSTDNASAALPLNTEDGIGGVPQRLAVCSREELLGLVQQAESEASPPGPSPAFPKEEKTPPAADDPTPPPQRCQTLATPQLTAGTRSSLSGPPEPQPLPVRSSSLTDFAKAPQRASAAREFSESSEGGLREVSRPPTLVVPSGTPPQQNVPRSFRADESEALNLEGTAL